MSRTPRTRHPARPPAFSDRLALALQQAKEQAKELLAALEGAGHPQTNQSSSLYLGLVAMSKQAAAIGPVARLPAGLVSDLEQLARLCDGKLAPIKPALDEALRLARARSRA